MLQAEHVGSTHPRYLALARGIGQGIRDGKVPKGSKLPPHRILADALKVSIGTVSRAYAELERLGLITSRVGDGSYVSDGHTLPSEAIEFRNVLDIDPSVIDLSINMHLSSRERDCLSESLIDLASDKDMLDPLLDYTPEQGLAWHREQAAHWLSRSHIEADPDNILCTNGAQHALLCAMMACLKPGAKLATEEFTYPGLITLAKHYHLKLYPIRTDQEGLIPSDLAAHLKQHPIAALFCTPTLQNPTASVMPTKRREQIAALCQQHNTLIIEDDVHGVLVEDRPAAMQVLAPERTLFCTSLSKAVSSGLRTGYLLTPPALTQKASRALRASCWMASPLPLEIASQWIADGTADALRDDFLREVTRRKALVNAQLSGLEVTTHPQCPHYWIRAPEGTQGRDLEHTLAQQHVKIKPSDTFAVNTQAHTQHIRISVTTQADDAALVRGFTAIGDVLRQARPTETPPPRVHF